MVLNRIKGILVLFFLSLLINCNNKSNLENSEIQESLEKIAKIEIYSHLEMNSLPSKDHKSGKI